MSYKCPILTTELVLEIIRILITALVTGSSDVISVEQVAPRSPDELDAIADLDAPMKITINVDLKKGRGSE